MLLTVTHQHANGLTPHTEDHNLSFDRLLVISFVK